MPDDAFALTDGEIRRAIERIDNRLDAFAAVTPEVFAAEIRVQQEIHQQHRDSINKLFEQLETNRKLQEVGDKELRGWMRWMFALLITNLVALLGVAVTAAVALL